MGLVSYVHWRNNGCQVIGQRKFCNSNSKSIIKTTRNNLEIFVLKRKLFFVTYIGNFLRISCETCTYIYTHNISYSGLNASGTLGSISYFVEGNFALSTWMLKKIKNVDFILSQIALFSKYFYVMYIPEPCWLTPLQSQKNYLLNLVFLCRQELEPQHSKAVWHVQNHLNKHILKDPHRRN